MADPAYAVLRERLDRNLDGEAFTIANTTGRGRRLAHDRIMAMADAYADAKTAATRPVATPRKRAASGSTLAE